MPGRSHRRWLRSAGVVAATILALGLGALALLQVPAIQLWLFQQLIERLNRELNGKLSLGGVYLRGFSGIELFELIVQDASGDTIVRIPHATIAYEAFALSQRRITLPTLSLDGVSVRLIRGRDGLWNFERLVRSGAPSEQPPDLSLWLRGVNIRNGTIIIIDSLSPSTPGVLGQGRWDIHNLELLGSAAAFFRQRRVYVTIRGLRFREQLSGATVDHFQAHAALTPSQLRFENVRLRMPAIGCRMDVQIQIPEREASHALSPDSIVQLGHWQGFFRLDSLLPSRIGHWFPTLPTLPGTVSGNAEFSGTLQRLQFAHMDIRLGKAHATLHSVWVRPWEGPTVRGVVESAFVPLELLGHLLPELPPEGHLLRFLQIRTLRFTLSPHIAEAEGQLRTAIGAVRLRAHLHQWNTPTPRYDITLSTAKLDLTPFLPRPANLGGTLRLHGSGKNLQQADAHLSAQFTSGQIGTLPLQQALISAHLSSGFLQLDTVSCRILQPTDTATANLTGWIQLTSSPPAYRLQLSASRFPIAALVGDTMLPEALTSRLELAGHGIHPDSIEGFVRAHVEELQYPNWTLLPFELALHLRRPSASARFLEATAEAFTIQLSGNWRLSTLPQTMQSLGTAVVHWLYEHQRPLSAQAPSLPPRMPLPDSASIHFRIDFRDPAWLTQWLHPLQLHGTLSATGSLTVNPDTALLQIDHFTGRLALSTSNDSLSLHTEWLRLDRVTFGFQTFKSYPALKSFRGALHSLWLGWQDKVLDTLSLHWEFSGTEGTVNFHAALAHLLAVECSLSVQRNTAGYVITTHTLQFHHFSTNFHWENSSAFSLQLTPTRLTIDTVELERRGSEYLRFFGVVSRDSVELLKAELQKAQLLDLWRLLPLEHRYPELSSLQGEIDTLTALLSGSWHSPQLQLRLVLRQFRYDAIGLGTLRLTAALDTGVMSGTIALMDSSHSLRVHLFSLPSREELYRRVPISARVEAERLNAALLNLFIPELRQLRGTLSATLALQGFLPTDFHIVGSAQSDLLAFQLGRTGISYTATFNLQMQEQQLKINRFILRNLPEELPNGMATVTGTIGLRELRPWSFDLQFQSPQLLVLNYSSARVYAPVYGPLIIATGQPPVQLIGTWDRPRLIGTLLVRTARLFLPADAWTSPPPTPLLADYYWTTPTTAPSSQDTSSAPPPAALPAESGLAERLFYDLRVYLLGNISITMDLAPTQQLIAELEAENPATPLAYVTGPEETPQLLGRLRLRPGSVYKFYRNFTASGTISFTTGEIDNPELDIEVSYQGFRLINNQRQSYEIRFTLRGTRRNLSIGNWSYSIAGVAGSGDESKLFNDVVWLLLVGRTQEELEGTWTANGNIGREVPLANLSTIASKAATELLRGIGAVYDVQLDPTTGTFDLEQIRARITGQLGGITLRWGGFLTSPLQQAEFTVEIPLSELLRGETAFLRKVLLQLSTTTGTTTVVLPSTQRLWEVRISVRL